MINVVRNSSEMIPTVRIHSGIIESSNTKPYTLYNANKQPVLFVDTENEHPPRLETLDSTVSLLIFKNGVSYRGWNNDIFTVSPTQFLKSNSDLILFHSKPGLIGTMLGFMAFPLIVAFITEPFILFGVFLLFTCLRMWMAKWPANLDNKARYRIAIASRTPQFVLITACCLFWQPGINSTITDLIIIAVIVIGYEYHRFSLRALKQGE